MGNKMRLPWSESALACCDAARYCALMTKRRGKILRIPIPKRRWAQFSLATLLTIVTVLCMWLAWVVNSAHTQRDAMSVIEARGGHELIFEEGYNRLTKGFGRRLRQWLPREYTDEVEGLAYGGPSVTDEALHPVCALTHLRTLLLKQSGITDAGLANLKSLTKLTHLSLDETAVSDAGLAELRGLTQLQELRLEGTKVTDAGLCHLSAFPSLGVLSLTGTSITDDGLKHLRKLKDLETLWLGDTEVTDAGEAELHCALPNCTIIR